MYILCMWMNIWAHTNIIAYLRICLAYVYNMCNLMLLHTRHTYIQGVAVNCGLFFGGPLLSSLGLWAERLAKTDGRRSKWWCKCSGTRRPAVAMEMACLRITTQSFAQKITKWRFLKALAIAMKLFSMWKSCEMLVWTWRCGEGEKKRSGRNERQILRI